MTKKKKIQKNQPKTKFDFFACKQQRPTALYKNLVADFLQVNNGFIEIALFII